MQSLSRPQPSPKSAQNRCEPEGAIILDQHSVLQSAPGPTLYKFFFFTIAYNTNITYPTRLISLTPLLTFLQFDRFLLYDYC